MHETADPPSKLTRQELLQIQRNENFHRNMNADLGHVEVRKPDFPQNDKPADQLDILETELVKQTSRSKMDVAKDKLQNRYSAPFQSDYIPADNQPPAPGKDFLIRRSDIYSDGYYNSGKQNFYRNKMYNP